MKYLIVNGFHEMVAENKKQSITRHICNAIKGL